MLLPVRLVRHLAPTAPKDPKGQLLQLHLYLLLRQVRHLVPMDPLAPKDPDYLVLRLLLLVLLQVLSALMDQLLQ